MGLHMLKRSNQGVVRLALGITIWMIAGCNLSQSQTLQVNVNGLDVNEVLRIEISSLSYNVTTDSTSLEVEQRISALTSIRVFPNHTETSCIHQLQLNDETLEFNLNIECFSQTAITNLFQPNQETLPEYRLILETILAETEFSELSLRLSELTAELIHFFSYAEVDDLISSAIAIRTILQLIAASGGSTQGIIGALIALVRSLVIPAAIAVGMIVYVIEMFLVTRVMANAASMATRMLYSVFESILAEIVQREDYQAAECKYLALGGPVLDLSELPLEELHEYWTSFDPRQTYRSGQDLLLWLQSLSIPSIAELTDFIAASERFIAANRAAIQATQASDLCGRVSYEPKFNALYNVFEEQWRTSPTQTNPQFYQPVRRHPVVAVVDGHEYVGWTNDRGYYYITVPQSGFLEKVVMTTKSKQVNYQPDGIGPDACNGSQWDWILGPSSSDLPNQTNGTGNYRQISEINRDTYVLFEKSLNIPLSEETLPVHVDLYHTDDMDEHGKGSIQGFVLSMQGFDHLHLFNELYCQASPDIILPPMTLDLYNTSFGGDNLSYVRSRFYIDLPLTAINDGMFIHEVMHGTEFFIHGRSDSRDYAGSFSEEEIAQNAFTEGWMRANQVFMYNDGYAAEFLDVDASEPLEDLPIFMTSSKSVYSVVRVTKALIDLHRDIGYPILWEIRDGEAFNTIDSFQNMFAYLAILYNEYPEHHRPIRRVLETYFGIDDLGVLTCTGKDYEDYCAYINEKTYPADTFDLGNAIGEGIANMHPEESAGIWGLYEPLHLCMWSEGILAPEFNFLNSGGSMDFGANSRTGYVFADRVFIYPGGSSFCAEKDMLEILDTDEGCDSDTRQMRIMIYKMGRRFEFENGKWGKYGFVAGRNGACPKLPSYGSGIRLVDVRWRGEPFDCFSFIRDGCEHMRWEND